MPPSYPGLEIDEDLRQERREWIVQRIAWVLLYALLAAIAFGLLGDGPLSNTVAGAAGAPLRIEHERFMRHRSADLLRVTAVPSGGRLTLAVNRDYLQRMQIERITPEPESVAATADGIRFTFAAAAGKEVEILFEIRPDRVGTADASISAGDGAPLRFSQFVYP